MRIVGKGKKVEKRRFCTTSKCQARVLVNGVTPSRLLDTDPAKLYIFRAEADRVLWMFRSGRDEPLLRPELTADGVTLGTTCSYRDCTKAQEIQPVS